MFTYSESVLKICIAQLAKYVGFHSINELAFEILIDLVGRFIIDFGKLSVSFANQCNRTQVNLDDICFVLKSLELNLDDLICYLNNVNLPFSGPLLPNYPVTTKLNNSNNNNKNNQNSTATLRIQFPSQSECNLRKEFYQDWQPSLNFASSLSSSSSSSSSSANSIQYLSELLSVEQRLNIETKLEQLDLIDYIEQKRKLKITEDYQLNRQLLNRIRSNIKQLNISGFTELEAQVPNYIYLSADGQALSFGNREGRLPEPRKSFDDNTINHSSSSKQQQKHHKKSSSKRSSTKSINKKKKKAKQQKQSIEKSATAGEIEKEKSVEQIVSDLVNEMISSIGDQFNQSFYDENEAAKTLVLLSYDSSKSVLSSTAGESPTSIDEDENVNQIDYSLTNSKYNYDLNNNYTPDLNNNSIDQRKLGITRSSSPLLNGSYNNNLINGHHYQHGGNDDYQMKLNDVKNLTISDNNDQNDDQNDHHHNNVKLTNNHHTTNGNNLPKLKFKLNQLDKYKKESLANSFETSNNHQSNVVANGHCSPTQNSTTTTTTELTTKNHHQNNTNKFKNDDLQSTKDKKIKKQTNKKSNSIDKKDSTTTIKKTTTTTTVASNKKESTPKSTNNKKSKVNKIADDVYYCPTCNEPDDGSPMIGCDQCDNWYHYTCQSIVVQPREEKWFCLDCSVQQHLDEKKKAKKLKKLKELENTLSSLEKSCSKKRSKQVQKEEDKKLNKKKSSSKNDDVYYCPSCLKPDDGSPMVGCDNCDSWFHLSFKCAGLTKSLPEDEAWYCTSCKKKKKLKKLKK